MGTTLLVKCSMVVGGMGSDGYYSDCETWRDGLDTIQMIQYLSNESVLLWCAFHLESVLNIRPTGIFLSNNFVVIIIFLMLIMLWFSFISPHLLKSRWICHSRCQHIMPPPSTSGAGSPLIASLLSYHHPEPMVLDHPLLHHLPPPCTSVAGSALSSLPGVQFMSVSYRS